MNQILTSGCDVMVQAEAQQRHVNIRVTGDVDVDAVPALSDAVARVAALSPEHVFVDLDEVGFAGATLPNFLSRLVDVLPQARSVTVCSPRPMHQWVLEATGMAQILMIRSQPAGLTATHEVGGCVPC